MTRRKPAPDQNNMTQADLFDGLATRVDQEQAPHTGRRIRALETGRNRLVLAGMMLASAFAIVGYRVVDLTLLTDREQPRLARYTATAPVEHRRADIVDRNGVVLATSLPTVSLYADPKKVMEPSEAAEKLARLIPDLTYDQIYDRLRAKGRFVYLKRNLTPSQHFEAHRLGLPGIGFERGERRIYPHGNLIAHVIGGTDVDGRGLAGVEKRFNAHLTAKTDAPLKLSLDVRVQAVVKSAVQHAIDRFSALGGMAVVMDAQTSEVISLVSLPDFDPHKPAELLGETGFNRATKGVYELGSSFKLLTAAMALDTGTLSLSGGYDATKPIRVARHTIRDFKPKNRWLSLPEIMIHSSNIGAAKMALELGTDAQKTYLGRLGLLRPSPVELPEVGRPLSPRTWRDINTATISFGHGLSVSPLQLANAMTTVVNGGVYRPATIIDNATTPGTRVFSAETSAKMRGLMRLVVSRGTGRNADVPGYLVGGKTGTAEKLEDGRYVDGANISSFVGAFPIHKPRYVVIVAVDEPKGRKDTFGYATGGWVAAPAVKTIITQMAGILGIAPVVTAPTLSAERAIQMPTIQETPEPPTIARAAVKPEVPQQGVDETGFRAAIARAEQRARQAEQ